MALPGFIGRTWSRLFGGVAGFAIGAAAADTLRPAFRDLEAEANKRFPSVRHDASLLARMVVEGVRGFDAAAGEANEVGVNDARFAELVRLAGSPPPLEQAMSLWRRGTIDQDGFQRALNQAGLKDEWREPVAALKDELLQPPQLAGMVARGIMSAEQGETEAARLGLSGARFRRLVEASRQAPNVGEILELVNRGETTEADARAAFQRAGILPEFHDPILSLRNVQPGPSDVVRFAVRDVFSPATRNEFGLDEEFPQDAMQVARKIGLTDETLGFYWAAHWDLPSPQQGFAMFHRRIIDRRQLELLLKALDFAPRWRDKLIQLAYLVPGRIDLRRMYEEGVITKQQVYEGYLDIGYAPIDAERLTEFATRLKMKEERDLTKAEIVALYELRAITVPQAHEWLDVLGYDEQERGLILQLADSRRGRAFRTAAVGAIRSRFKDREIDTAEATRRLQKMGVPSDEIEAYLDLWLFERDENPRRLTPAELFKARDEELIDTLELFERLKGVGYTEDDAALLMAVKGFPLSPS